MKSAYKMKRSEWDALTEEQKVQAVEAISPSEIGEMDSETLGSFLCFHTLAVRCGWPLATNLPELAAEWHRRTPEYNGTKQWARQAHIASAAIRGQFPEGEFGSIFRSETTEAWK